MLIVEVPRFLTFQVGVDEERREMLSLRRQYAVMQSFLRPGATCRNPPKLPPFEAPSHITSYTILRIPVSYAAGLMA